jgi:hypothetical protein
MDPRDLTAHVHDVVTLSYHTVLIKQYHYCDHSLELECMVYDVSGIRECSFIRNKKKTAEK